MTQARFWRSPGCPLGPQQPPNRRPHARRDRHPRQLRRQLPRRDSRRGCVCSMRLDYESRLDFPLWCEWSPLGLPPPPPPSPVISPVAVKDCNPVGTVNRLSGDSDPCSRVVVGVVRDRKSTCLSGLHSPPEFLRQIIHGARYIHGDRTSAHNG